MSGPELPYIVSGRPIDCLRKTTKLIDQLRSDINKLHESNQFMYNYMVDQLQIFKHYSQPPTVPDIFQGITLIFRQTIYEQDQTMYNYIVAKLQNVKLWMQYMVKFLDLNKVHERDQMMLQNYKLQMQPQAVTVSDLFISKVTSQKIFVSDDLNPDLDPVQAIDRVFSKTSKFFTPLQCNL